LEGVPELSRFLGIVIAMFYRDVIEAQHISEYILRLRFRDGTQGEIDLEPELVGPTFEPLKDLEQFKLFHVDPELHTGRVA
jgi:Protein of unknown function (DUF2442)